MFRRIQLTFAGGAIFISCVDQKLFTLAVIHLCSNSHNIGGNPSIVIPLLANQNLTPILGYPALSYLDLDSTTMAYAIILSIFACVSQN